MPVDRGERMKDCAECFYYRPIMDACHSKCHSCENKSNFTKSGIEVEIKDGCELCNGKIMESEFTDTSIVKTNEEGAALFVDSEEDHFREFIFINYCPMCGKKLVKE